ncbi:MAG: hypothetical protein ACW975_13950 [Candidatus Thorarchaeota archaeon]
MAYEKGIDYLLKNARILLSRRRLDDAQSTAEIALRYIAEQDIEKLVSAHLVLGEVHREKQEWEKAEGHFRKATELDSENLEALFGLVRSLEPQSTSEKKREEYRAASAKAMQLTGLDKKFGPELIDFRERFGTLEDDIERFADLAERASAVDTETEAGAATISRDERMMLADFVKRFSKIHEKARDVMKVHGPPILVSLFQNIIEYLDNLWMSLRTETNLDTTKIGFPLQLRVIWPPLDGGTPLAKNYQEVSDVANRFSSLFARTDVISEFIALRSSVVQTMSAASPSARLVLFGLGLLDLSHTEGRE